MKKRQNDFRIDFNFQNKSDHAMRRVNMLYKNDQDSMMPFTQTYSKGH